MAKKQMSLIEAEAHTRNLRGWLYPEYVRQFDVAGSIRRKEGVVGDIEIVAVPVLTSNLFGDEVDEGMPLNQALRENGRITLAMDGPKYKQFTIGEGGPQVDLFLCTPHNRGYILMLRTGPAGFSRRMITPASKGGFMPDRITVSKGHVYVDGHPFTVSDEAALFDAWNMQVVLPEHRKALAWKT
jgi:DNA polymerase/3'-5' exonuclease PolX